MFDKTELLNCKDYLSGLMTKGFIPEISSVLNQIESTTKSAFNDLKQLVFFVEKDNYK